MRSPGNPSKGKTGKKEREHRGGVLLLGPGLPVFASSRDPLV